MRPDVAPTYSLFVPFTRLRYVESFLEMLDNLAMPLGSMEFVFYNDTDDKELSSILQNYLDRKSSQLHSARLYMSNNPTPAEDSAMDRRVRIVEMKNKSRDALSDTDYTICIEDDTFIQDPTAIYKLINHIKGKENIGFVGGVQRGRWGFSIIGAWEIDDVHNPQRVATLPYKESGLQAVDGAGWYFYITPTNLYKNAVYHTDGDCFGPDVCYVMDLRKQSYECYVDWSLVCGHMLNNSMLYPTPDCIVAEWLKTEQGWAISTTEKPFPTDNTVHVNR